MYKLDETIRGLCKEKGITAGKMCNDLGLSRGMMTDLKNGRKQTLTTKTLSKIAEYFGTSVDYLIGTTSEAYDSKEVDAENKHDKSVKKEDDPLANQLFACYGEVKENFDADDVADIELFMRMKAERKRKKSVEGI